MRKKTEIQQPFFLQKQIISILLLLIMLILEYETKNQSTTIYLAIFSYLLITLVTTFLPWIRSKINYPYILHNFLFILPFYLVLEHTQFIYTSINKESVISGLLGFIGVGLLLYSKKKEQIFALSSVESKIPLSKKDFIYKFTITLYSIIGEEIWFRLFLIPVLIPYFGAYAILISSLCFVHIHYINRWANTIYSVKSYMNQFVLSLILSSVYFITSSFLIVLLLHILYDLIYFILLVKRLLINSDEKQGDFFNDY